ncbi:DUF4130 domain-containing protein [Emticicia sp. CRIBPO]|uniref:TIGR03915 family putative DNA repair protein n=1 Tax=Emticicia sp. CRIBPO TaxID=2683258 RepID=UPI001412E928|nr:TIGR03915 family putative DNA repair protein [Emticicia sp. CRIBPO]NBA85571.1 DUF4130 domain-containing protein [Emticicia sp. CRIBPO]
MVIYVFDGTFSGLLTAVFESFGRKHRQVKLVCGEHFEQDMFSETVRVTADKAKAERVWEGLKTKGGKDARKQFYSAFLSESAEIFQHLFDYALYVFNQPAGYANNFGNSHVLAVSQMAQKVHREKHRMEAFIRFQKSGNGLFFAVVSPDYNVLPLILKHFKDRYADQVWVIYDERRKYGIHYDLHHVHEVTFDFKPEASPEQSQVTIAMDEKEELYTTLWKEYFKSTNIKERKNMKLHIQHVPKRYWRYLVEKEDDLRV